MQKISYIHQINGFIAKCSEDALPANAVVMYLMLFSCFNRSCWRNTWMRFTIQQLMAFTHVGSPNTVYNMRRLLKELGYIDYRSVKNGMRAHVEYRLIPLGMSSRNGSGITAGMTDMADTTAGMSKNCAFADIPCDNRECSANESYTDENCANTSYADKSHANKTPANEYVNSQGSVSEHSKTERSHSEYSVNERSKNEYSLTERSKSECSFTENSINAPAKSECSNSENSNSERSISENSRRRYAGECSGQYSGECSKIERSTDSSPNREEKEKKIYTSHDTSVKYQGEINNNTSTSTNTNNNNNNANSSSDKDNRNSSDNKNKQPVSVSEFLRTNGDYLLCVDAYKDYFHQEPPAGDKVLIIRFLADYGAKSTLSAMDVMMQNKADSLSYCETVLRQSQWKINRKAIRRPTLSKEWAGWRMA